MCLSGHKAQVKQQIGLPSCGIFLNPEIHPWLHTDFGVWKEKQTIFGQIWHMISCYQRISIFLTEEKTFHLLLHHQVSSPIPALSPSPEIQVWDTKWCFYILSSEIFMETTQILPKYFKVFVSYIPGNIAWLSLVKPPSPNIFTVQRLSLWS